MTYEEALKVIENDLQVAIHDWDDPTDECQHEEVEALLKAKKAVKKQIPKKVKNREFETASCPVCGTTVLMLANELEYEKYCPQCGQALDWSEEK